MVRLTIVKTKPDNLPKDWYEMEDEPNLTRKDLVVDLDESWSDDLLTKTIKEDYATYDDFLATNVTDRAVYEQGMRFRAMQLSWGLTFVETLTDLETGNDLTSAWFAKIDELYP